MARLNASRASSSSQWLGNRPRAELIIFQTSSEIRNQSVEQIQFRLIEEKKNGSPRACCQIIQQPRSSVQTVDFGWTEFGVVQLFGVVGSAQKAQREYQLLNATPRVMDLQTLLRARSHCVPAV